MNYNLIVRTNTFYQFIVFNLDDATLNLMSECLSQMHKSQHLARPNPVLK